MKTIAPRTFALGIASLSLLAGGAAVAQHRMGDTGPVTRAEVVQKSAEHFAKMDVNGDGQLDPADREAKMAERFAAADTNGDGALTQEEMTAAREARRGERAERRGDRAESRGERRGKRMGRRGGRGLAMMQRADTDGNGSVSQAEFQAAALARFDAADADKDGTVTAEERRAARQAHRAERQAS